MSESVRTHLAIDPHWVGAVTQHREGYAEASLTTRQEMAADDKGLVHGGFVFGLADYAAMVAVGDPNVVLGAANVRFVAPVRVGDVVAAEATVLSAQGRKREVEIKARVGEREVLTGTLTAFVLDHHVLEPLAKD